GHLARHRPNCDAAIALGDVGQVSDAVEVDQQAGSRETKIQQWDQALATGQQLRFSAAVRQRLDRLLQRMWSDVFKRCWLHPTRSRMRRIREDTKRRAALWAECSPHEKMGSYVASAVDEVELVERPVGA